MGIEAVGQQARGYQFHPGRDGDGRPSPLLARFVETLVGSDAAGGSATDPPCGTSPMGRGETAGSGTASSPSSRTLVEQEEADDA